MPASDHAVNISFNLPPPIFMLAIAKEYEPLLLLPNGPKADGRNLFFHIADGFMGNLKDAIGIPDGGLPVFSFKTAYNEMAMCHILEMVNKQGIDQCPANCTNCW